MYMCSKFRRLKLVSLTRLTAPFFPDKIQFNQPSILIWGSFLTSWKMNSSLVHKVIQLGRKKTLCVIPPLRLSNIVVRAERGKVGLGMKLYIIFSRKEYEVIFYI